MVVGVDLGGTNMNIGVVNAAHQIIGRDHRKTHASDGSAAVLARMTEGIETACADAGVSLSQIASVGIAAPGAIDIPRGVVLAAPNLRWTNLPLRDAMQKRLRRPVVIDNDVNAAVWGEYVLGAGKHKGSDDVLGVWLGTGVGGGLVIDGKLFHGEFFTAGEVGQTVLFPHGKKKRRILEDFCSRTGMSRTIMERLDKYPSSSLHEVIEKKGAITGSKQLARAYKGKDKLAHDVVSEAAELLGIAIANWVTVLSLDLVIVGGGVTEALGSPFLKLVRKSFERDVFPDRCKKARLVMTKLMDDAGLLGAALLARSRRGRSQ